MAAYDATPRIDLLVEQLEQLSGHEEEERNHQITRVRIARGEEQDDRRQQDRRKKLNK